MADSNMEKEYCRSLPIFKSVQNVQGISSQHGSRDEVRFMKDYQKKISLFGKMKRSLGKWFAKDQIKQLEEKHQDKIKQLKEKHQDEIKQLKKEHQDEINGVHQYYQDEIKRLNKEHQDEMEWLYKEHQDEIDRLKGKLEHQEEVQQNDSKRQDKEIQELKLLVSMLMNDTAQQQMKKQFSQQ